MRLTAAVSFPYSVDGVDDNDGGGGDAGGRMLYN